MSVSSEGHPSGSESEDMTTSWEPSAAAVCDSVPPNGLGFSVTQMLQDSSMIIAFEQIVHVARCD